MSPMNPRLMRPVGPTVIPPPAQVTGFEVFEYGANYVDLTWVAPSSSSPILSYELQNFDGVEWTPWATLGVVESYRRNAVSSCSQETWRLRAISAGGPGPWSATLLSRPACAPTDISLSPSAIAENAGANAVVGTLSAEDFDTTRPLGDSHTYSLVAGTGSSGNAAFNIIGNQLRATNSLDFEAQPSYSIRVRATDAFGLTFEKALTVTVTNVAEPPVSVDYLVVAGGGGGGAHVGGGGGAGGVRTGTLGVTEGSPVSVVVGAGGTGATGGVFGSCGGRSTSGGTSTFGSISSTGGGGGGTYSYCAGLAGGSGGGAGSSTTNLRGVGTSGQGNDGGLGCDGNIGCSAGVFNGGGGGGASSAGGAASSSAGGDGGAGVASSISGSSVTYGGGGGGAVHTLGGTAGSGGSGGGGAGNVRSNAKATSGSANTGGGGGGAAHPSDGPNTSFGGDGGSGVVIIRAPRAAASTTGSPTVTTSGGMTIYTFTGSGSITF